MVVSSVGVLHGRHLGRLLGSGGGMEGGVMQCPLEDQHPKSASRPQKKKCDLSRMSDPMHATPTLACTGHPGRRLRRVGNVVAAGKI